MPRPEILQAWRSSQEDLFRSLSEKLAATREELKRIARDFSQRSDAEARLLQDAAETFKGSLGEFSLKATTRPDAKSSAWKRPMAPLPSPAI